MLRYFYLLCFLICIEWTISYEYNESSNYRYGDRKIRKARNRFGNLKNKRQHDLRRDKIIDIKNPVKFDVSSFIQNPSEDTYEEDRKQLTSNDNDYSSYIGVNVDENNRKKGRNTDYLSFGTNNAPESNSLPLFKDINNPRHFNLNALSLDGVNTQKFMHTREDKGAKANGHDFFVDISNLHKPEKKCAFKHLQFPFFSHSKPVTKMKKDKKRNMICINCSKEEKPNDVPQLNFSTDRVKKRSYEEMLCPECRRKFIMNNRFKHSAKGMIHNSRQFYKNIKDVARYRSKDAKSSNDIDINNDNSEEVTYPRNDKENGGRRDRTSVKDIRLEGLDDE